MIDEIHLYIPAIGRMTPRGYGVALTDPIYGQGKVFWFHDRATFTSAHIRAQEHRDNGIDRNELYFSERSETFASGYAAVQFLLNV